MSKSVKKSALAYDKNNALNAICPYFTMFPLEYPTKVLKKHRKEQPVILDPFCGRGTTLFAARNIQLSAWGIDTSPVAVAIARAKLASCDFDEPLALASQLISNAALHEIPESPFFLNAYDPLVLKNICAIREGLRGLKKETDASVILRAAMLGCMHGPLSKNVGNAGYFSNQMPRTYASKPDYATRYWQTKKLVAPRIDVLNVLRRKIERLTGLARTSPNSFHHVLHGDARSAKVYKKMGKSPSLVITSPPYYGMRTYVQDQWLRNWFLGGPAHVDYAAGEQLDHGGQDTFAKSLGLVWKNIAKSAAESDTLHMYVRFGIIPSSTVDAKELFKNSLEESMHKWRLISVREAESADAGKRQADQMKAESAAAVEFDFHVERT